MKLLNKLIRRLLLWSFKDRVQVFQHQHLISDYELVRLNRNEKVKMFGHLSDYEMAQEIGLELYKQGFLILETRRDVVTNGLITKFKVYVIK